MRKVELESSPMPGEEPTEWAGRQFALVSEASGEQPVEDSADAFTLTNFDEVADVLTDFDATNATLGEMRRAFATLILYIQQRGPDRRQ